MSTNDMLPWELIWRHDGHVTDEVVTAMADGEEAIVPAIALEHVAGCDACSRRMGESALASAQVGSGLAMASAELRKTARPRFPAGLVAAALVLAIAGMIPAALRAPAWLASTGAALIHDFPVLMRTMALIVRTVPQGYGSTLVMMGLVSAAILIAAGVGIARAMSRVRSAEGGA